MRNIAKEMRHTLYALITSKMRCKLLILFVVAALATLLYAPLVSASILGTAESFAVLAGTGITNTGATTITGNIGSDPNGTVTDQTEITFTNPVLYTYELANTISLQAKTDLTKAYNGLNNMIATQSFVGNQLGGAILTSGVYAFPGSTSTNPILLDGTLTLDAEFNNNAFWVFQIPFQLTAGVGSSVVVTHLGSNGGNDDGLFWTVGSLAEIKGSTSFEGNILAGASITLGNSATILNGRALAQTADVTMDTNTISIVCPIGGPGNGGPGYSGNLFYDTNGTTVLSIVPSKGTTQAPEPATMLLLGLGLMGLAGVRRKFKN